jgi:hypothetical protein
LHFDPVFEKFGGSRSRSAKKKKCGSAKLPRGF